MAVTPLVKAQPYGNHKQAHGDYEVNLEWKNGAMLRCRIYSPMATIPQVRYKGRVTVIKTLI